MARSKRTQSARGGAWSLSCLLASAVVFGCTESGPNPADMAANEWRLATELRIDGYDEDLVPITDLAVMNDGTIAVLQGISFSVRLFSPDGAAVVTVGRQGQGPGEFEAPLSIGRTAESLWIYDTVLRRLTTVDAKGELLGTRTVGRHATDLSGGSLVEMGYFHPLALRPDGALLGMGLRFPATGWNWINRSPIQFTQPEGNTLVQLDRDGNLVNVVARTWITPSSWTRPLVDGGSVGGTYPFHSEVYVAVADDGRRSVIAFANVEGEKAGSLEVISLEAGGDTVFNRAYPFTVEVIPKAAVDSAVSESVEYWIARGRREVAARFARDVYIPPMYPPLAGLILGYDDTVWLQMRDNDGGWRYLVLSEFGEVIGKTTVPVNVDIRIADSTHVWALEEDELGVQSVLRFRIERDP